MLKLAQMLAKKIAACVILFSLSGAAPAALFKILKPQDLTKTQNEIITLIGRGNNLKAIKINQVPVDLAKDGSFTCALILRPGKNQVEISGQARSGKSEKAALRILRLISFPDLAKLYDHQSHWAGGAVILLATLGIVEGYPDNNFYPEKILTRGELATWLARAEGLAKPPIKDDIYFDVPKEHWRAPYIYAVVKKNWMKGFSRDIFGVEDGITRGEIARTVIRAEGGKFKNEINRVFKDVPQSNPFYRDIKLAGEKELFLGVSKKTSLFDPNRDLKRAEAAILLSRFTRVQWQKKWLYDFNQGYTKKDYCRINTPPKIFEFLATPVLLTAGKESVLALKCLVGDRQGLTDIVSVKADLSPLGGPPDAELKDDGKMGDETAKDGIYSLNFTFSPADTGEFILKATATDQSGWEGHAQTSITIVK